MEGRTRDKLLGLYEKREQLERAIGLAKRNLPDGHKEFVERQEAESKVSAMEVELVKVTSEIDKFEEKLHKLETGKTAQKRKMREEQRAAKKRKLDEFRSRYGLEMLEIGQEVTANGKPSKTALNRKKLEKWCAKKKRELADRPKNLEIGQKVYVNGKPVAVVVGIARQPTTSKTGGGGLATIDQAANQKPKGAQVVLAKPRNDVNRNVFAGPSFQACRELNRNVFAGPSFQACRGPKREEIGELTSSFGTLALGKKIVPAKMVLAPPKFIPPQSVKEEPMEFVDEYEDKLLN